MSSVDLYLSPGPFRPEQPVNVFQQVPGTAGEPFMALLRRTLAGEELRQHRVGEPLSHDEQSRLHWVAGRSATSLIPLLDRPVRVFVIVRDPVRYTDEGSNVQSRSLLAPFFDVDELPVTDRQLPEADLWRERLGQVVEDYALLREDRPKKWIDALGPEWATSRLPQTPPRAAKVDAARRRALYDRNWLDRELHRRAVESTKELRHGTKELRQSAKALLRQAKPYRRRVIEGMAKGGVPLDLYFSPAPLGPDEPVNVFQHVPKTAGTSFRALLNQNLEEVDEFRTVPIGKESSVDLRAAYRELHERLTEDERGRLHWVAGHSANFLIALLDRPVSTFTIVREPLDRVLSRYFFAGSAAKRQGREIEGLRRLYLAPSAALSSRKHDYSNGQSRNLLAPFFDVGDLPLTPGPPADADLWRARLFTLVAGYRLLAQDTLQASIDVLADSAGWAHRALPRIRVNPERPRASEIDHELRETIQAYNWLDAELYNHTRNSL